MRLEAGITRRGLFRLVPAVAGMVEAARVGSAAGHFWDTKPMAEWTPEEMSQLTGNSPWAKDVPAQYRSAMSDRRPDSEPMQGRGEAKVGECGLVPCANVMPGRVVVIWESALVMRQALKSVIPPEYNGHYVISIRGLQGEQTTDRLQAATDLSAKGKPPLQPGLVSRRNGTWLFGFSRELLPLDANDKDVYFTVHTGSTMKDTLLRATFSPRDMVYRGMLTL